jgi:hypothetical protein
MKQIKYILSLIRNILYIYTKIMPRKSNRKPNRKSNRKPNRKSNRKPNRKSNRKSNKKSNRKIQNTLLKKGKAYENVSPPLRSDRVKKYLTSELEGYTVIDAGTGNGYFPKFLNEKGIKAYGFDTNPPIDQEYKVYANIDDILKELKDVRRIALTVIWPWFEDFEDFTGNGQTGDTIWIDNLVKYINEKRKEGSKTIISRIIILGGKHSFEPDGYASADERFFSTYHHRIDKNDKRYGENSYVAYESLVDEEDEGFLNYILKNYKDNWRYKISHYRLPIGMSEDEYVRSRPKKIRDENIDDYYIINFNFNRTMVDEYGNELDSELRIPKWMLEK